MPVARNRVARARMRSCTRWGDERLRPPPLHSADCASLNVNLRNLAASAHRRCVCAECDSDAAARDRLLCYMVEPMDATLAWMIANGSYAVFFAVLIVAGLGVPIPEDIVLIAAGVLSHHGVVSLPISVLVCFVGVMGGDMTLFFMARRIGPAILKRRPLNLFLTEERRERVERMFEQRGGVMVFTARHLAGLRAPVFAVAATHGMSAWRFFWWDFLGLCVSAPLVIGLGYVFAESIDLVFHKIQRVERAVAVILLLLLVVVAAVSVMVKRMRATQRRMLGEAEPDQRSGALGNGNDSAAPRSNSSSSPMG
jgi:membrane protein DedA with SNARE-associated domain